MPAVLEERTYYPDLAGRPLVNGKVYFGVQNADPTVSPITIYSDRELTTVIANPQILDASGQTTNKVWVPGRYSIRVDDLNDVQQYQELDNGESSDVGVTVLENVAGANTITATAASTITVYEDKEQYAFTIAQVNTTAVTLNIDGVGAKSVLKNHDQAILPAEFEEDQVAIVIYNLTDDAFEWVNHNNKVIDFYEGPPVATATTPDIWSTGGNTVHLTGTTTIVDFADAPNIGARRELIADDAFTLTDGSGITLEGAANISIVAGDRISVYADAVDAFRAWVTRADGRAVTSPTAATQAEQEAGASSTVVVTPSNQQFHPSSVKVWANLDGTGTIALRDSYNMTGVTDNGVGNYTFTFDNDFTDANRCVYGTINRTQAVSGGGIAVEIQAPLATAADFKSADLTNASVDVENYYMQAVGTLA